MTPQLRKAIEDVLDFVPQTVTGTSFSKLGRLIKALDNAYRSRAALKLPSTNIIVFPKRTRH